MDSPKNDSNENDETAICDIMSDLGRFQKIQYVYSFLATLVVTMTHINYVFVAGELNYRCHVPECENSSLVFNPTWWPNSTLDKCSKPILKQNVRQTCTNDSFTDTYEQCSEWIYETNDTVIAEFDLGCQPWKASMIGTTRSIGMLIATIIAGWMTDRFGRKPVLIFCLVGSSIGHLKAFTSSYYVYVIIEFVEGIITGGAYTAISILMTEIVGKKKRLLAGVIYVFGIYLGESVFAFVAMCIPFWKDLIRVIYSPSVIFLSYIYLLKESPRWQILNGRIEGAKETLLIVSKDNKVNIDRQKLATMDEESLKKEYKVDNYGQKETLKDAFKSKEIVKRLLIGAFCRFSACLVYYGLMINSVYLPGNRYTSFILTSVMSYPGDLIALYLMNKIGRKLPLAYGYILCGLLCVASVCFPDDYKWLKTTFFLIGKMVISGCFIGVVTYTIELFPTSVRGSLYGICALVASFGNVLAPLTPILKTVSVVLPSLTFGALSIISGLFLTLTPETKDSPLMDTIGQVEYSMQLKETNRNNTDIKGRDNIGFNHVEV